MSLLRSYDQATKTSWHIQRSGKQNQYGGTIYIERKRSKLPYTLPIDTDGIFPVNTLKKQISTPQTSRTIHVDTHCASKLPKKLPDLCTS